MGIRLSDVVGSTSGAQVATLGTAGDLGAAFDFANPATYEMQVGTLTANTTGTLPTPAAGAQFVAQLTQDATGGRTLTLAAPAGSSLSYPQGTVSVVPTAGAVTEFAATCFDGVTWEITPLVDASLIPISDIDASGTADATTFLRGDGSWTAPAAGSATQDSFSVPVVGPAFEATNLNQFVANSAYVGCSAIRNTTGAALNDYRTHLVGPLEAGTWDLRMYFPSASNGGIVTVSVSVDNTTWTDLGTIDQYAAATSGANAGNLTGVAIPSGAKYIRVKVTGKNASSSGYVAAISHLSGVRKSA